MLKMVGFIDDISKVFYVRGKSGPVKFSYLVSHHVDDPFRPGLSWEVKRLLYEEERGIVECLGK